MCLYKARKGMVNWSHICNDSLLLIMFKLSAPEDIVHFGAVCRQWRSVSVENRHLLNKSVVVPWLMLANQEDSDRRRFYSLSTQKVYHLNLPEARSIRQCWSSQGWLITVGLDWEYQLLNPVSRALIRLPSQPTFIHENPYNNSPKHQINLDRDIFIEKMVLSSPPSPSVEDDEKCMVMAITYESYASRKLSFLRLGDEVWRAIDDESGLLGCAQDVISFNDQFYAIDCSGELYICDISSVEPEFISFAKDGEGVFSDLFVEYDEYEVYLVESEGELFSVSRSFEFNGAGSEMSTVGFDVFKLNFDKRTWTKVKSLDNRALFVGNVCSFAIFSNDHPGFELNCIYFDHNARGALCIDDEGAYVFRMETKEIESLGLDFFSDFRTPPLWICPSL